jgi:hypothetical protein
MHVDYCIKTSKEKMRIYVTKLSYSAFSIFSNVREVNLVILYTMEVVTNNK